MTSSAGSWTTDSRKGRFNSLFHSPGLKRKQFHSPSRNKKSLAQEVFTGDLERASWHRRHREKLISFCLGGGTRNLTFVENFADQGRLLQSAILLDDVAQNESRPGSLALYFFFCAEFVTMGLL